MDKFQYLSILKNNLEEFIKLSGIENPIFQQENDPKHTSAIVKKYPEQCDFSTLLWPSQSPDLNPIEHLWAIIKQKLSGFRAKNDLELFKKVEEIWYSIEPKTCQKLVMSIK